MISAFRFATISHYIILDIFLSVCLKGLHGSKHLPPHPEHLCCPTKVSHLHRSHVHCSVHHQSITLIGSIVTYVNVAKMSRKALYCIALPALSSTYYFQEPSSCRISSTPTARARFPSEAGCLSLSANNLKQTYFEQFD